MQKSTDQYVKKGENNTEDVPETETQEKLNNKERTEKRNHAKNNNKKHRFVYPENWKDEIKNSITLKTEIPTIKKEDYLKRPDFKDLRKHLNKVENKIKEKYEELKDSRKALGNMRERIRNENKAIYDELKVLNTEKKVYLTEMGESKTAKANLLKKVTAQEMELNELSKKCYNGKIIKKETLLALIEEKEAEFRNTKKTATEEKVMINELAKLKNSLKVLPLSEKLMEKKALLKTEIKTKGKASQIVYDKLKAVNDKITALKEELNKNKKAKEEEEQKKVVEEVKEEKKEREKTPQEIEMEGKIDLMVKEIEKLKADKKVLKEKFDKDSLAYDEQTFELKKIEFSVSCKQYLQRQEKKKQYELEKAERLAEDEKYKKDRLQFKYQKEIDLCESLRKEINDMKPKQKMQVNEGESKTKNNEVTVKDDNLEVIQSKRDIYQQESLVLSKKNNKKKRVKKTKVVETNEDSKLLLNFYSIQLFDSLKVLPPSTYKNIDEVVKQLEEKRDYFLKRREEEMANADQIKEKDDDEEKAKPVKKAKRNVVNNTDEEFPGL